MDFGKKVYCGNFVIVKKTRSLSKREMKKLRDEDGVPADVRKHLTRGSVPYMRVEAVGGSWAVEYGVGTSMFGALDALGVAYGDDGVLRVSGAEGANAAYLFAVMYADATVVGDIEYQRAKVELLDAYLKRIQGNFDYAEKEEPGAAGEGKEAYDGTE